METSFEKGGFFLKRCIKGGSAQKRKLKPTKKMEMRGRRKMCELEPPALVEVGKLMQESFGFYRDLRDSSYEAQLNVLNTLGASRAETPRRQGGVRLFFGRPLVGQALFGPTTKPSHWPFLGLPPAASARWVCYLCPHPHLRWSGADLRTCAADQSIARDSAG